MILKPQSALSRRRFVRTVALGAAFVGSGAAATLAAELDEKTKGGERKLGVALMGLGLYAGGQLGPGLKKTKLCRLAGVVTGDPAKGRHWSRKHGFSEANIWNYDTIHEMAGHPDIDIIYVVTPNTLHAEHTIKSAQAGKHVICEKPMASSVADCTSMLEACDKANVKLSIGYRLQFDPHHIELDRLAREKDFGVLNRMSGAHSWVFGARAWRIEKALSGGGPLMDVGIYVIQAACRGARGQPVAVSARELPKTNPALFNEVEETIEWTMEFPDGVTCQGRSSYAENGNDFKAEGPKGWIRLHPAFAYGGIGAETSRGPLDLPSVPQQSLQMDDFASCILTGRKTPVPGTLGRDHMAIIEAIYKSASDGGRRVEVQKV
ncbi:MAG TPA: Gfo/Idh/MocA family oxidoreductase [Opitutaceae bacterium]|jgi:glucose-fructose oxidoreductase